MKKFPADITCIILVNFKHKQCSADITENMFIKNYESYI